MDVNERKITKIAREAEKLVLLSLRDNGVGTAEIDLIHAVRHNPGCTQAQLVNTINADKAAVARRVKNLEEQGYIFRKNDENDKRRQFLYPTEKAETLKASKVDIESEFYDYIFSVLSDEEKTKFDEMLDKLYKASKSESRAGFPNLLKK